MSTASTARARCRSGHVEKPTMDVCEHAILIHEADDVLIATRDLPAGRVVRASGAEIVLEQNIPAGHKLARRALPKGTPIRRYGEVIGAASTAIAAGELVHVHNLDLEAIAAKYEPCAAVPVVDFYPPDRMRHFEGYRRPDGRVGTRNYVALASTVNCSASVTQFARERFRDVTRDFPGVDGVIALTHKSGCGQVLGGEDHRLLERVLAGYARHPNVAAYVVIGLGCEVNQAPAFVARHKLSVVADPRDRP